MPALRDATTTNAVAASATGLTGLDNAGTNFSWGAWLRIDPPLMSGGQSSIWVHANDAWSPRHGIAIFALGTGELRIRPQTSTNNLVSSPNGLVTRQYNHFGIRKNATAVTFFRNGRAVAQAATTLSPTVSGTRQTQIGGPTYGGTQALHGVDVWDIRVFPLLALTDGEMRALADPRSQIGGCKQRLVYQHNWRVAGTGAQTLLDESGNGNSLTTSGLNDARTSVIDEPDWYGILRGRTVFGYVGSSAQIFSIGVAIANALAQDAAATAGALNVAVGNATAAAAAHAVAAVAGTLAVAVGNATASANANNVAVAAGALNVAASVAIATAAAQSVAAAAGALAVPVGNATASANANNVAAAAGALNVAASVAIATANGQDVTVSFSGVTLAGVATATAVGQNVNAAAGALAVPVGVATATATPRDVVATAGALAVPVGVATAAAAGQNVTATAGALAVTLLTATAAAAAQSVLVTAGALTIPAGVGVAAAVPSPVTVTVSGVSVALGVAVASAYAQVPLVIYGSTAATIIAVQDVLDRSPSVAVFDRSPTAVVVLRSGAAVVQDRSPSFAIIEVT